MLSRIWFPGQNIKPSTLNPKLLTLHPQSTVLGCQVSRPSSQGVQEVGDELGLAFNFQGDTLEPLWFRIDLRKPEGRPHVTIGAVGFTKIFGSPH